MKKVCNVKYNDRDLRIPIVLWAYRTTYKKLIEHITIRLVYGQEEVMPMEFLVPSLHITSVIKLSD